MLEVEIHMTGEQVVLTDRQEEHMTALAREIIDPSCLAERRCISRKPAKYPFTVDGTWLYGSIGSVYTWLLPLAFTGSQAVSAAKGKKHMTIQLWIIRGVGHLIRV